jgi:hypothetical protein
MSDFRLLLYGAAGRVTKAIAIDCENDEEAIERVGAVRHPFGFELWQGLRRVRSFNAWGQEDEPPTPRPGA